jgi:FAD/FMN-containing dehydrogenase
VMGGLAKVGAGTRTGVLCKLLSDQGLAIPTGTCPSVGIAGLTLGGGLGVLGRVYGLTADSLVAAEVVLADGRVVQADEETHADLFWALRGAGAGSFGVATSFTFAVRPAPRMTNFLLVWPYEHAAAVIAAWQEWAPLGPDELSADLVLSDSEANGGSVLEVYGAVRGGEQTARKLLAELAGRANADPVSLDCRELSYRETCAYQAEHSVAYDQIESTPLGIRHRQGWRVTKSEFFAHPLPSEAIAALLDRFGESLACRSRSVGFAPWSGAYNRRSAQETAFPHRDQLFLIEHLALVDPAAASSQKQAAEEWVRRSWRSVHPWASGGVYPGFPDPDLDDWGAAYYGDNYSRLTEVKARYDPDDVLRFEQSIPVRR